MSASIAAAIEKIQHQSERLDLVIYCVGLLHDGDFQPEKSLRQTGCRSAAAVVSGQLPLVQVYSPSICYRC